MQTVSHLMLNLLKLIPLKVCRFIFLTGVFLFSMLFVFMDSCIDKNAQALYWYEEGLRYEEREELAAALKAFLKAVDSLEDSTDRTFYAKACNKLSEMFFKHSYYERAMDTSKRVLDEAERLSDKTELSRAYRGIGKIHYIKGDWKQALQYFQQAQELEAQVNDFEEIASIYNNLSNTYCEMEEYKKALDCNTKVLILTKDSLKLHRNLSVRGRIYTHLCRYDSALYYILQASLSPDIRVRASSYYKLVDMPVESGMTDSMRFVYLSKAKMLSDSIENPRHSRSIIEGEHQYQINALKNKELTKWTIVIITIIVLASVVGLYFYLRFKQKIVKYEHLIAKLNDGHHKLNKIHEQSNAEHDHMLVSLINNIGKSCADNFMSKPIYTNLQTLLKENRMLNYEEQEKLIHETFLIFNSYLKQLKLITDRLSDNDLFLCCLLLLDFNTRECALCRGVSNETIRSQRTRIKKKIPQNLLKAGLMKAYFKDN